MNKLKLTLFTIGCLAIVTQLAFYLWFPVERPARYRSGWSEQNFDVRLDADKKTPLYGKPDQNGLRDGMSMYLPAGDWGLYVHLEYEGEVLFMFDFGRARRLNAGVGGADIVGKAEWSSLDWQFNKIKCSVQINEWCEILVSAKSAAPATVSAKSRMFVFGRRDGDCLVPDYRAALVDGRLTCIERHSEVKGAYYLDGAQ